NTAKNLRLLCSEHPSVADVCRKIGINRQQFNKYLAGKSLPSNNNAARICAFFEIERADLSLPHADFLTLRKVHGRNALVPDMRGGAAFGVDSEQIEELERHCGVYRVYSMLPYARPNMLLGVCLIQRVGDRFISKFVERTQSATAMKRRIPTSKMFGAISLEGGFLYILDCYSPQPSEQARGHSLTILHSSQRGEVHTLAGVALSVAGDLGAAPFASKIVYQKVPDGTSVKQLIRDSGRLDIDDPRVPADVRRLCDNRLMQDQPVLTHQFI
ncbi:unnamed protein product, partial [Chrysoparadoxa australica]